MDQYEELVRRLTDRDPEDPDETTFSPDGDLDVTVAREEDGSLGLYSVVCQTPHDLPGWVFEEVALGNYSCAGTAGATLGIYPLIRSILLSRFLIVDENLSSHLVEATARTFIATARHWKDRLARLLVSEADSPDTSSADHPEEVHDMDFPSWIRG